MCCVYACACVGVHSHVIYMGISHASCTSAYRNNLLYQEANHSRALVCCTAYIYIYIYHDCEFIFPLPIFPVIRADLCFITNLQSKTEIAAEKSKRIEKEIWKGKEGQSPGANLLPLPWLLIQWFDRRH